MIRFNANIATPKRDYRYCKLYYKANFDLIKNYLLINNTLSYILKSRNPADKWSTFSEALTDIVNKFVPNKKCVIFKRPKIHNNKNYLKLIKLKFKYWKQFKNTKNPKFFDKYKHYKLKSKLFLKNSQIKFENELFKKSDKKFFKYIRNSIKIRDSLPRCLSYNNVELVNDVDIANAFNDRFYSVYSNYTVDNLSDILPVMQKFSPISNSEIHAALKSMSLNSACGPGGVPVYFIKSLGNFMFKALSNIFDSFLESSYVPDIWKSSIVCPIYKKSEDKSNVKSYRPISVTNIFSRLFERILMNRLNSFIIEHSILNSAQHGFCSNKSTLSNLIDSYDYVTESLESKCSVDVI